MRRSLRYIVGLIIVAAVLAFTVQTAQAATRTVDLLAGQHHDVGDVTVENDATNLYVTYTVTEPDWCLFETHLYVGLTPPETSAPGQFPYGDDTLDCVTTYTETIPLSDFGITFKDDTVDDLYIAAHGAVEEFLGYSAPDLEQIEASLPQSVEFSLDADDRDTTSYFTMTIQPPNMLAGEYEAWCVDAGRLIDMNTPYTGRVVSSYDLDTVSQYNLVDKPQNLDALNFLINQDPAGKPASAGGQFTVEEVQWAMWTLVDNNPYDSVGIDPATLNMARVNELVNKALTYGEGWQPETCSDDIAVIIVPHEGMQITAQVIIGTMPVISVGGECKPIYGNGETVWGDGDYPIPDASQNWASYFTFTPTFELDDSTSERGWDGPSIPGDPSQ